MPSSTLKVLAYSLNDIPPFQARLFQK